MNDFEAKLNNDLPWSPKFRAFACEQENVFPFGTEYLAIQCKYRNGDHLGRYCEDFHLDKMKYLSAEVRYGNVYGDENLMCRLGGPAQYNYKFENISHPIYFIRGHTVRPIVYWLHMCKRFKKIYSCTRKKEAATVYFTAKRNVPCPYSYSMRHQYFVWKLNGKRVSFSYYWRYFEQKFIDLRYELKDDDLWKNLTPISIAVKRKR